MNDIDKEKDVDMEEVRRICSEKTAEELDAEFEAFKKEFAWRKNSTGCDASLLLISYLSISSNTA